MTQDRVCEYAASVHIARDGDVSMRDQLTVLSPYFANLQNESRLSAYLASGILGSPRIWLLYWEGNPAAHWSSFPFPFWIDGRQVIGGKPELGAVHRNVVYRFPRPDLFGMLMNEVVSQARDAGWPLLVTKPNMLSRASLNKRGFQNVAVAFDETVWLLRPQAFVPRAVEYVHKRYGKLSSVIPSPVLNGAIRCALHAMATITAMRTTLVPSAYELIDLPLDDLRQYSDLLETNYWPHCRLTVWREPDFLQNRLRAASGYQVLGVWSRRQRKVIALAIIYCSDEGISLLDVLPPAMCLEKEFWAELIRFAIRSGASALKARLYLNNPFHAAVANQSWIKIGSRRVRCKDVFVALALDSKYNFAYDPNVWAGTDMLYATF